jgi:hypothetical protein
VVPGKLVLGAKSSTAAAKAEHDYLVNNREAELKAMHLPQRG